MLQSMCCLLTNLLVHSMHLLLESEAVMIYFCLFSFVQTWYRILTKQESNTNNASIVIFLSVLSQPQVLLLLPPGLTAVATA